MKVQSNQAQLQATIMASLLRSNTGIDAAPRKGEDGKWFIEVLGAIPEDYILQKEVAGIKIVRK